MSNHLPGRDPAEGVPTVSDSMRESGLPYVSKSRIKTYQQCPLKFFWKYWCEVRSPGTYHTVKGTQVHETFENFHLNLMEYIEERNARPHRFTPLLEDWRNYAQWTELVGAFFAFEERRWKEAQESVLGELAFDVNERLLERWAPIEVEAEAWLGEPPASWVEEHGEPDYVSGEPPCGDIPWMGRADLIADSRSVPGVEGDGVTIIDYKSGSVPDEQYRDTGIYMEGEYYGWLFEEFFDVDAVAGYFPVKDLLITSPYPNQERRQEIERCVLGMQQEPEIENFPLKQSGLCHYNNPQNEGQCWFHEVCPVQEDCHHCPDSEKGGDNAPRYEP